MLKGQAKTDYQREYMRLRRWKRKGLTGSNAKGLTYVVRPTPVRVPRLDADGREIPDYE